MARKRYLTGLDQVRRTFERMTPEAQEALTDALNRGAEEIAARARLLAPEGTGPRPATITIDKKKYPRVILKDSIKVRSSRAGILGVGRTHRTAVHADVVVTDPKAGIIEFGSQETGASPFFYVAVRSLRKRVRGRVTRALKKAAKEIARGG